MKAGHRQTSQAGFTLIETIISLAVMSVIMLAVSNLFALNLLSITTGKTRALGLALASEQIEYLRDLPYDSLATQGGSIYPPGNIPDDQYVTRNNIRFRIHTDIAYADDPYDGNAAGTIPGKPTDLYSYDYKQAQIKIYTAVPNRLVATLTTSIGAKAAETSSNTGILSVTVLDASGQAVPNATVHIVNPTPNPDVDITTTTDSNGLVQIPKLPPDSSNGYKVTVSLAGYSTDQTYPDPPGSQTAVKQNVNVLVQQITSLIMTIDRTSTLTIQVNDTGGNPVNGLNVTTKGSKTIYAGPDVPKYTNTTATNASGQITLAGVESDSYSYTVPSGNYIVTTSPYQPSSLNPNTSQTVTLVVASLATHPTVNDVEPAAGGTGTNPVTLTITGTNLASNDTVKLKLAGQSDIVATGVTATGSTTLTATVNLTGATPGNWDVVVTNPAAQSAVQAGGFVVSN